MLSFLGKDANRKKKNNPQEGSLASSMGAANVVIESHRDENTNRNKTLTECYNSRWR